MNSLSYLQTPPPDPDFYLDHAGYSQTFLRTNFPCRAACPVHTNAGGYVSLISQGRYKEAFALARAPNPFASVCGRICAHPCEAACRRSNVDQAISIRALKRFATERHGVESATAYEDILRQVEVPRPKAAKPGKVAVVGAGPSGLSCAHDLALMGHQVVVFEAAKVAGGMLRLGIPEYRLPRDLLACEISFIAWLGVEIRLSTPIGEDTTWPFARLRKEFDAVFIGAGCMKGRSLAIEGLDLPGVTTAVDYLLKLNLGETQPLGKNVLVIGGGNVAYDAARSARRFGGTTYPEEEHHNLAYDAAISAARLLHRNVTMSMLEGREEMPADPEEIEEGSEEGITLVHRRAPHKILADAAGRVRALQTLDVQSVFDAQKRFAPVILPNTEKEIPCDSVIVAIGQAADLSFLGADHGVKLSPRQVIEVDRETLATSAPGVYAGGDIAFGPRIAIEAVADGRRAALAIDTQITGRTSTEPALAVRVYDTAGYEHPFGIGDYEKVARHRIPTVPIEMRETHSVQVEIGYDEEQARIEGGRCLRCWVNTIFDSNRMAGTECIQCGGCVDVCPEECIDLVSILRISRDAHASGERRLLLPDGSDPFAPGMRLGAALVKDESACIRCGLCARRCPTGCITMQAFFLESEAARVQYAEAVL